MAEFGGFDTRGFNTDYMSAMDREYVGNQPVLGPLDNEHSGHNCDHHHDTNDVNVKAGDLGMSFGLGPVPNIPAVLGKLRAGSKQVELGFMGMGKGGGGGHTAGMYGKKQRQALREAARANRLDFTTHTSVGVFGLAGQDRGGNFSREAKITSLQEIKRAIEFAADVGEGGPVVVHTGEFKRPFSDSEWNKDGKFESFPGEDERASFYVVDQRTGNLIAEAKKGRAVTRPKWYTADKDDPEKGIKRGDYINYYGEKVDKAERVPVFDPETRDFETEQVGWETLSKEAQELTEEAREFWKKNKGKSKNDPVWENSQWKRFAQVSNIDDVQVFPEEAYILNSLQTNAANARGFAMQYTRRLKDNIEQVKDLKKQYEVAKEVWDQTPEHERFRLKKRANEIEKMTDPEQIKEALENAEAYIKESRNMATGQWTQAAENEETMKYVESARRYALEESYDSYARAGIFALRKSEELEKKGKLKRPIMVAMENLFPESYGAHPEEIMRIVRGSRDKMVSELVRQRGMSENEARKKADTHLTITLDVGHLNMWRKYWKQDPKLSIEENDRNYNKWMVDMVGKMAEQNMVGHVHLDDNYGYQDEHLAPGEGNAPIVEMVKAIKEKTPGGYKADLIVEPGADFTTDTGGFASVMKAWKLFGSPISGAVSSVGQDRINKTWGQIQYSHFGQNQPAYFSFQPYSPSEDWTLWSGVPFE